MKNIEPKKKGKGKKKKAASIALDITETAMYESLDTDNPVNPKPSLTSQSNPEVANAYYTYIPSRREGGEVCSGKEEELYHAIGPDSFGISRVVGGAPPPVPERNNTGTDSANFYHLLEGAVGNLSAQYEDPTSPNFQVCHEKNNITPTYIIVQPASCIAFDCK